MALSALDDLSAEPTTEQVAAVLGPTLGPWSALRDWLSGAAGIDTWEWGSSGKKYGWALRAKAGKRTIAYMIPQHGAFLVGLVLGDRAMAAVRDVELAPAVRDVVMSAKRYGEGTGFRLPVADGSGLEDIKRLIEIKIEH